MFEELLCAFIMLALVETLHIVPSKLPKMGIGELLVESNVPEETELLYSNTTAVAVWGMAALNVGPSTSSAARIWVREVTLRVTVV